MLTYFGTILDDSSLMLTYFGTILDDSSLMLTYFGTILDDSCVQDFHGFKLLICWYICQCFVL